MIIIVATRWWKHRDGPEAQRDDQYDAKAVFKNARGSSLIACELGDCTTWLIWWINPSLGWLLGGELTNFWWINPSLDWVLGGYRYLSTSIMVKRFKQHDDWIIRLFLMRIYFFDRWENDLMIGESCIFWWGKYGNRAFFFHRWCKNQLIVG